MSCTYAKLCEITFNKRFELAYKQIYGKSVAEKQAEEKRCLMIFYRFGLTWAGLQKLNYSRDDNEWVRFHNKKECKIYFAKQVLHSCKKNRDRA